MSKGLSKDNSPKATLLVRSPKEAELSEAVTPLRIGSTKQLFLDNYIIDDMQGVARKLHRPVRYGDNPVLRPDRPWERKAQGVYTSGGTVFFDEEDKIFKMWYRTTDQERKSVEHWKGSQDDLMPEGGYKCGYAVSKNGVDWEKPILGQVDSFGSKENNLIPPGEGGKGHIRRPNIIKDYDEPDESKRYKMVYMDEMPGEYQMSVGYSVDGIRWRMGAVEPIGFERPVLPHGTMFGCDPRIESYVYYHRKDGYNPEHFPYADVDGRKVRTEYGSFVRSTSADFEEWGDTKEVFRKDPYWDPPNWDPGSHMGVLAAVLYTEDLYIGVLDVSVTHYVEDAPPERWETAYMWEHPRHTTELVISRDGESWHRVAPHWEFLRPGMWGEWDSYGVAVVKPLVVNDELLIYYTGTTIPDSHGLPGHHLYEEIEKPGGPDFNVYSVGLAKMRLDGFASIDGYAPGGSWTTRPFVFDGDRLVVNVRAPEQVYGPSKASVGSFRAEVLDAAGAPIPGYTTDECDPLSGDQLRHTVTWRGNRDVSRLAGQPVRLRFNQSSAALYSFQLIDGKDGDSSVNLMGPGNRGRP